jgi:hypothetical protein
MNKKLLLAVTLGLGLAVGAVVAREVKDWHDIHAAHDHVKEAIREMERARAANHYDMAGHGAKAEELLRQAEHEIHESIEAARGEK